MKAPPRIPLRAMPDRARWLAVGVLVSVALHGAVLAALLLWPAAEPKPDDADEGAVALVFADIVDPGGGGASEDPAPPEPPSPPAPPPMPVAAAPPPPPPDAPPPPPAPPAAAPDAGPPTQAGILPPPAPELPSPPEPVAAAAPPAEPAPAPVPPVDPPAPRLAEPTPAPPTRRCASPRRPRRPIRRPLPSPRHRRSRPPRMPRRPRDRRAPPDRKPRPGRCASMPALARCPTHPSAHSPWARWCRPGPMPGSATRPPEYPSESRRRGEEGVVRLALRVGIDGRVESAEVSVSSGHARLDEAAVAAARRWRFRPATQGGLPVAATLPTAVHFRLTDTRGR